MLGELRDQTRREGEVRIYNQRAGRTKDVAAWTGSLHRRVSQKKSKLSGEGTMAAYLPVEGREWTEDSEMGWRVAKKGNPVVSSWGRRRRGSPWRLSGVWGLGI